MKAAILSLLLFLTGCAEAKDYALRLEFEQGYCSGTAISRNVILTAAHCFGPGARLVKINGQPAYAMKIVRSGKDHALVRVTMRFDRWATFGPAPTAGDRIHWTGNPAGLESVFRQGHIAQITPEQILVQAPAFGGDSGAGIFNERGQLVGVLTGYRIWIDRRSGLQFALTMLFPLELTAEDWREIR